MRERERRRYRRGWKKTETERKWSKERGRERESSPLWPEGESPGEGKRWRWLKWILRRHGRFTAFFFHSILRKASRDWRSMIFRSFLYNVNGDRSTREAVPRIEEVWICRGSLWQRIREFILKLTKNGTWYASHNAIFWWNADKETLPRSIATRLTPAHRSFSPALFSPPF